MDTSSSKVTPACEAPNQHSYTSLFLKCRSSSVSETCFDQDAVQRETEERLETEAVNMIIERLLDLKPSLYWHYTREVCRLPWCMSTANDEGCGHCRRC